MPADEPAAPAGRALSPEEVGARVSAILEAAERDARAVIDAAHRELAAREQPEPTLEELARALDALSARVAALERSVAAAAVAASAPPPPPAERPRRRAPIDPAARVRAIELALAGYSREAITDELAATMSPTDVEQLLDEVLSP